MLWLDLETRSQCDLIKHGTLRYAQDISTQVICMSYAFDNGPITTWFAEDHKDLPSEVIAYIEDTDESIYAHNASFERYIFDFVIAEDYFLEPPALTRWRCSSARAMAHGLPAKLADICKALNLPKQKQSEGARLIRDYSTPGCLTDWKGSDKQLMQDYCEMDVETMRMFCSLLRELEPFEWEQYHITEIINDRGVPLDITFAEAALEYADYIRADVNENIIQLTDHQVKKSTERKARDLWLKDQLSAELIDFITITKNGVKKIKFDKEYRSMLSSHEDCPAEVNQFVELVEQAGGATISKYSAMVNTHYENRVYGSIIWSGAGATGRYSSRGLQLQNFRRDVLKDPEPEMEAVITGVEIDKPAEKLGRLIRSTIYSKNGITFSDYSQIEARVLPWLSNDGRAEVTLNIFKQGRDLYTENAIYMFDLNSSEDVTPELRQAAKQGVLACGFGGAKGAVKAMARGYGLNYEDDKADAICQAWRKANPWAQPFWYGLKQACRDAYQTPHSVQSHGRLSFYYDGNDWLWMRLPSGRHLAYFQPRFELVEYPWGDEGWELTCLWGAGKPKVGEGWPRRTLSHLILAENATQATAADIMREAIVRAHYCGLEVLFTVHDELVVEGNEVERLTSIMENSPTWAERLPIAAETKFSMRYGK